MDYYLMMYSAIFIANFGLIIYYAYKNDIFSDIYRRRFKESNLELISGRSKVDNCADFLKVAERMNAVLGEGNSKFWTNPKILEALDIFLEKDNTAMSIVMGPYFDFESREFLLRLIKGVKNGKIQMFILKARAEHHIKEFIINGEKNVVSEPPHRLLQKDRQEILVCHSDRFCSERFEDYFEIAKKNAEEVTAEKIIDKFKFIINIDSYNIPASENQIIDLRNYLNMWNA